MQEDHNDKSSPTKENMETDTNVDAKVKELQEPTTKEGIEMKLKKEGIEMKEQLTKEEREAIFNMAEKVAAENKYDIYDYR